MEYIEYMLLISKISHLALVGCIKHPKLLSINLCVFVYMDLSTKYLALVSRSFTHIA